MFNFKVTAALLACTFLSGCVIIIDQSDSSAPSKYSAHAMKSSCGMNKKAHAHAQAESASKTMQRMGMPPTVPPEAVQMPPPRLSQPAPVTAPLVAPNKAPAPAHSCPHCGGKATAEKSPSCAHAKTAPSTDKPCGAKPTASGTPSCDHAKTGDCKGCKECGKHAAATHGEHCSTMKSASPPVATSFKSLP